MSTNCYFQLLRACLLLPLLDTKFRLAHTAIVTAVILSRLRVGCFSRHSVSGASCRSAPQLHQRQHQQQQQQKKNPKHKKTHTQQQPTTDMAASMVARRRRAVADDDEGILR